MLKTTKLFEELALRAFRAGNNKVVGSDGGKTDETVVNFSKNKKSKKLTRVLNIGATEKPNFLTLNAKKAFNNL